MCIVVHIYVYIKLPLLLKTGGAIPDYFSEIIIPFIILGIISIIDHTRQGNGNFSNMTKVKLSRKNYSILHYVGI
jgi:hypothetical protein